MKCQRCPKPASLHITEVTGEASFDELHLCEECAQKFMNEPPHKPGSKAEAALAELDDTAALNQRECPHCGIKFAEFRTGGRLGCPRDYESFREELVPLLENIHGETRHVGKAPRREPRTGKVRAELAQLRKQLQQAVTRENYEDAAKLRDKIKHLDEV